MRRILVCLDRSPCSAVCLPYALAVACAFGSAVTLVHVMESAPGHSGSRITDPLGWEVERRDASTYLERLAKEASASWGLSVEPRIEQGRAAERITAIAREVGADLTVVASHGQGGVGAWSLGGTAQQVLAVSRGSVLVARSASPARAAGAPSRILVPLDGALRSESVLPTVARLAEVHDAEILLVHAVAEPLATAMLHAEDLELARRLAGRLERNAGQYLDDLRARLPSSLRVRTTVTRHADERRSLLEVGQREKVDLVVMSAHGSVCNPSRPFGSVTQHLLSHAPVPLLALQDLAAPEQRTGDEHREHSGPPLRAGYAPGQG